MGKMTLIIPICLMRPMRQILQLNLHLENRRESPKENPEESPKENLAADNRNKHHNE